MKNIFQRYPELRRVIVNLKSGTVIGGVVWQKRRDCIIIKNANLIMADNKRVDQPIDGEVIVYLAEIDFVQVA